MKKQVVVIHGGDSFSSYADYLAYLKNREVSLESFLSKKDWKSLLADKLGEDYQVITPRMPNKQNAKYEEWKIWFEKLIPHLDQRLVLIGHSLGGVFLAKYLSENDFSKKIIKLILVAAPHNNSEDIGSFKIANQKLKDLPKKCQNIHIFHSQDDPVVPVSEAEVYKINLVSANIHIFKDRGHFNMEDFPEIVDLIRS